MKRKQEDGINPKEVWRRVFGFEVGDIVVYQKYPEEFYKIVEVDNSHLIMHRVTERGKELDSSFSQGIPWKVTLAMETDVRFHRLRKVL